MANLYLTEQGAVLGKSGDRLIVTKKGKTLLEVPCHHIDAVLIFGNVHFTTPAVRELFEHGIEMALLTRRGRLLCQLTPPMPKNVPLRLSQYRLFNDPVFALPFSRNIVRAKVRNGLSLIRQYAYNHKDSPLDIEMRDLVHQDERITSAQNTNELLGHEGNAARIYFSAFAKMIRSGFEFPGRRRRPAPDPVNALLSFGYTLLTNELASLLDGIGFDPHIGMFHRPDYGRPSLAADMAEEFRTPVVDRFTLRLINTRVFTADDFTPHVESGSMYLKRESLRKYFTEYETYLGEGFTEMGTDDDSSSPATFREHFRRQAYRLERALTSGTEYEPFLLPK